MWIKPLMILLIIAGLFMVYQKVSYESRDFYAEYYTEYPPYVVAGSEQRVGMTLAMELYGQQEYEKAIPVLDMVIKNPSYTATAHVYRGLCKLNMAQHWEAIQDFEAAKKSESTLEAAEWYKILSLIALEPIEGEERKSDAIVLLEYYVSTYTFKKAEAKELLSDY